jgi:hypothetical protein
MDPSPAQISAMADELSALAMSLETASDPAATKHARAAVVMKAKNLIGQVQDPMEAIMDHVTNVSLLPFDSGSRSKHLILSSSRSLWSPQHAPSWKSVSSKQYRPTEASTYLN